MNMLLATMIYMMIGSIGMAVFFGLKGDLPMSIVWSGYSFANTGFIWQALK